jgi:superfamily II DNA or RNA helicase
VGLQDVNLRDDRTYNTLEDDPARTFFLPCLSEAVAYDRAVGYFRSSIFSLIGAGIDEIVRKNGKIRIIASPHLDDDDITKINSGYELRKAIEESMVDVLSELSEDEKKQLGYLGRLIANGFLDFKIAVTRIDEKIGLYHDKYGIITDEVGDRLVFSGSNNETFHALRVNSETFTVSCPQDGVAAQKTIERFSRDFDRLWNGDRPRVEVFNLSEITYRRLQELSEQIPHDYVPEFELPPREIPVETVDGEDEELEEIRPMVTGIPAIPRGIEIRDYQENAINAWLQNKGRGVFKMATGTGKTITALALVSRFFKRFQDAGQPMLLVVVCPLKHLVDQWAENALLFGVSPVRCYDENPQWRNRMLSVIQKINFGGPKFESIVVTTNTFREDSFQQLLAQCNREVLLIADEVHNFGSGLLQSRLPERVNFRLGLSATPERFDEDETQKIYDYFGEIIFELDLKAAIAMGALCQYRYRVIPTYLDSDEMEKYIELAREIGQIYAVKGNGGGIDDDDGRLGSLLGERARILGHCAGKVPALKKELAKKQDLMFQLVYCAEGRPPLREEDAQIDVVQEFVGQELHQRVRKYVHGTSKQQRKQLLDRFSSGTDLKYLLSMRCLDEGVDIPDARVAYILASSRNPRQSVQRRGRVLRRPSGDDSKVADIIDFLALPHPDILDGEDNECEIELKLVAQELERAKDFAYLALNCDEAVASIEDIMRDFGIEGK